MQAHYHVPCPAPEAIAADLADLPPGSGLLLARDGETLAGFAAWSLQWPGPGLARGLYLKELYVARAHRSQGVGRRLMATLARLAVASRCARIDFTADAANPRILAFYAGCGAAPRPGQAFHRITGEALATLAGG